MGTTDDDDRSAPPAALTARITHHFAFAPPLGSGRAGGCLVSPAPDEPRTWIAHTTSYGFVSSASSKLRPERVCRGGPERTQQPRMMPPRPSPAIPVRTSRGERSFRGTGRGPGFAPVRCAPDSGAAAAPRRVGDGWSGPRRRPPLEGSAAGARGARVDVVRTAKPPPPGPAARRASPKATSSGTQPAGSTVVSNVPFSLTTPVLRHLLRSPDWVRGSCCPVGRSPRSGPGSAAPSSRPSGGRGSASRWTVGFPHRPSVLARRSTAESS